MLQPSLKQGCECNGIQYCPHRSFKDISEGVAGQVGELRVAGQALHQRLFERFSGTSPQLLLADSFGRTVSTDIFTCRPVAGRKRSVSTSVKQSRLLLQFFALVLQYLKQPGICT